MIGDWEDIRLGYVTDIEYYGDLTFRHGFVRGSQVYVRCKSGTDGPKRIARVSFRKFDKDNHEYLQSQGAWVIDDIIYGGLPYKLYCMKILNVEEENFFSILDFFAEKNHLMNRVKYD